MMKHNKRKKQDRIQQAKKSSNMTGKSREGDIIKREKTNRLKTGIVLLIIMLITYVSFSPSLDNDFTNWDDPKYLTENNQIKYLSLTNLKNIFLGKELKGKSYVPLSQVSFALEYNYFRLYPKIYHFNNLLLHLLNTALVFWLILLLCQKLGVSVITALLFGIHPLHVESVAWLTERKDVLSSFFYLAAIISYMIYRSKDKYKPLFYALLLLFFILSCLAKSSAVTLPVILVVIDYFSYKKFHFKTIVDKVPLFVLSLIWGIITTIKNKGSIASSEAFTLLERTLFAFYGIVNYLYKLIVPVNLSCFYPYPNLIDGRLPIIFYIAPFIVMILAFLAYKSIKYTKTIVFGVLFFFFTIALVLQFFPVGPNIVTDRYTYIPYIGIFFIIGQGYSYLQDQKTKRFSFLKQVSLIVLICFIGVLSYLSHARCKVWKNSLTLWTDVINKYPNNPEGYLNRGQYYTDIGELDKALPDYNITIALKPNATLAYINRGNVYGRSGEYDKALNDYSKAISLSPTTSKIYLNRGNVYGLQEKHDSAIADFTKAISLERNYLDAHVNRAISYSKIKEFDKAFEDFNKALEIHPTSISTYAMRAYAYLDQGSYDKSITDYNILIKFDPKDANSYFYRGLAYQKKKDYNSAIRNYSMTLKINPGNGAAYLNRSLSYDAKNDYPKALQDALSAQKLSQNMGRDYIERLRKAVDSRQ
ncbi:MAG: tetratricopeptide repeat protein [Bacteroidota bacterium]